MNYQNSYKSISCNVFDVWRILFFGFIIMVVFFSLLLNNLNFSLIISGILTFIILLTYAIVSYSKVSYNGESIKLISIFNSVHLDNVKEIKSWWNYDFGTSTEEYYSEGNTGKMRGHANKINCYVKFTSESNSVYIYEQIYLSDKFPNNHPYLPNEPLDKSRLVKVWDIDNCLKKLNIIRSNIN